MSILFRSRNLSAELIPTFVFTQDRGEPHWSLSEEFGVASGGGMVCCCPEESE